MSETLVSKEANGKLYEVLKQYIDCDQTTNESNMYYDLVVFDIEMKDGVPHLSELYCGEPHHEYDMDFFVEWVDEAIAMDAEEDEQ